MQKEELQSAVNSVMLVKRFGKTAQVQATIYRGSPRIDVRQWKKDARGELSPTKKGVSLPLQRWMRLIRKEDQINACLSKLKNGKNVDEKIHIGGPVYAVVCSPFWTVNIREWYQSPVDNEIRPSPRGVILKHDEWQRLMSHASIIKRVFPDLNDMQPCINDPDHCNQEGMMSCPECTPFTDYELNWSMHAQSSNRELSHLIYKQGSTFMLRISQFKLVSIFRSDFEILFSSQVNSYIVIASVNCIWFISSTCIQYHVYI